MTRLLVVEPSYCPYQAGFSSAATAVSEVIEGEHVFIVDDKPPAKSCGIFDTPKLPNDLALIDKGICDFIGGE